MDWHDQDNLADPPWQGAHEIDFDTPEGEAKRRDEPWTCWPIWFSQREIDELDGSEGGMKFDPYNFADPDEQKAEWDRVMSAMMDRFDYGEICDPANRQHVDAYRREHTDEFESEAFKGFPEPIRNPFSCDAAEPEYIVDGFILANDATAIYGDGGSGKTTMCEQLAIAHVLGTKWLGEAVSTDTRGKVLIMSGESDTDEVAFRLQRIMGALPGFDAMDNVNKLNRQIVAYPLFENSPSLIQVSKSGRTVRTTDAYDWLESKIELHRPKIVILDSLYNFYSDDESNKPVVHQFVMLIRRLAKRHGCSILLIGHPSLSGMESGRGTSGATTWFNAFRGWVKVEAERLDDVKEGSVRLHTLTAMKSQYAQAGKTIEAYWHNGCYRHVTDDEKEDRAEAAKAKFLELLAQAVKEGRALTWNPGSALRASNVFARDKARKGDFTKEEFKDAMDALRAEGKIEMREYTKANRHKGERLEVVS
jgi:RecA-family ATPase